MSHETDAHVSSAHRGPEGKWPAAHPEDAARWGPECEEDRSLPAEEPVSEPVPVQ